MRSKVLLISPNRCTSPDPVSSIGLLQRPNPVSERPNETKLSDALPAT